MEQFTQTQQEEIERLQVEIRKRQASIVELKKRIALNKSYKDSNAMFENAWKGEETTTNNTSPPHPTHSQPTMVVKDMDSILIKELGELTEKLDFAYHESERHQISRVTTKVGGRSRSNKYLMELHFNNHVTKHFGLSDTLCKLTCAEFSTQVLDAFVKVRDVNSTLAVNVATGINQFTPEILPPDANILETLESLSLDYFRGFGNQGKELFDALPPLYVIASTTVKAPLLRPPSTFFGKSQEHDAKCNAYEAFVIMLMRNDLKTFANKPLDSEVREFMDFTWCLSHGKDYIARISCSNLGEFLLLNQTDAENVWRTTYEGIVNGCSSNRADTLVFSEFQARWNRLRRITIDVQNGTNNNNRKKKLVGSILDARVAETFVVLDFEAKINESKKKEFKLPHSFFDLLIYFAFAFVTTSYGLFVSQLVGNLYFYQALVFRSLPKPSPIIQSSMTGGEALTSYINNDLNLFLNISGPRIVNTYQIRQMRVAQQARQAFPIYSTAFRSGNDISNSALWGAFQPQAGSSFVGTGLTPYYDTSGFLFLNATRVQFNLSGIACNTRVVAMQMGMYYPEVNLDLNIITAFEMDATGFWFAHYGLFNNELLQAQQNFGNVYFILAAAFVGIAFFCFLNIFVKKIKANKNNLFTLNSLMLLVSMISFGLCCGAVVSHRNWLCERARAVLQTKKKQAEYSLIFISFVVLTSLFSFVLFSLKQSWSFFVEAFFTVKLFYVIVAYLFVLSFYSLAIYVWFYSALVDGQNLRTFADVVVGLILLTTGEVYTSVFYARLRATNYFLGWLVLASFQAVTALLMFLIVAIVFVSWKQLLHEFKLKKFSREDEQVL